MRKRKPLTFCCAWSHSVVVVVFLHYHLTLYMYVTFYDIVWLLMLASTYASRTQSFAHMGSSDSWELHQEQDWILEQVKSKIMCAFFWHSLIFLQKLFGSIRGQIAIYLCICCQVFASGSGIKIISAILILIIASSLFCELRKSSFCRLFVVFKVAPKEKEKLNSFTTMILFIHTFMKLKKWNEHERFLITGFK